jgi:hypothetical protein
VRSREWGRCKDPEPMLFEVCFLKGPANNRRMRLFTLTAGRRLWEQIGHEACRSALDVAWRQAENLATDEEVAAQFEALRPVYYQASANNSWELAKMINILGVLFTEPWSAAMQLITPSSGGSSVPLLTPIETSACCGLLRDLFGQYRGILPSIEPALLAWNRGAIPRIAQSIYDERAFDRLPILADALKEAGCTDADILKHCRKPGEHIRGCWVVELLLGKT